MKSYSCWKIIARIKPEYISQFKIFINTQTWPTPIPDFIQTWHFFLKSISAFSSDEKYDYRPPFGNDSPWGKICKIENNIFTNCGSMINKDYQIQKFISKILVPISEEIIECYTSTIDTNDINQSTYYTWTDNELRSIYFREIQC